MMKMTRQIAFLLFAAALLTGSGCEQKCMVPAGEYNMTVEPIDGDCPEDVLATFESYSDTVTVAPETECSQFLTSVDGETDGGCEIRMEISATSQKTGLEEGQAVLHLKCEEKFSCKHDFDVIFSKK